jgi:Domain of unknown function (DUF4917)
MTTIDGNLADWPTSNERMGGKRCRSENGLSTNVYPNFAYASLYKKVEDGTRFGRLTDEDKRLFERLETQNFEVVLGDLATTIRVAEAVCQDTTVYFDRYRTVQAALGAAVRAVHISGGEVPEETLKKIGLALRAYDCVFNYKLRLDPVLVDGGGRLEPVLRLRLFESFEVHVDPDTHSGRIEAVIRP